MKKNNAFTKLAAGTLLIISQYSLANGTCTLVENASTSEAKRYIQCLDSKLDRAKQVQGTWIQKRKYELEQIEDATGNTQVLPLFRKSISNHEKYIQSSCQWRYLLKLPNATSAAINYKLCELGLINQFTDILKLPVN